MLLFSIFHLKRKVPICQYPLHKRQVVFIYREEHGLIVHTRISLDSRFLCHSLNQFVKKSGCFCRCLSDNHFCLHRFLFIFVYNRFQTHAIAAHQAPDKILYIKIGSGKHNPSLFSVSETDTVHHQHVSDFVLHALCLPFFNLVIHILCYF
nr:MAG TPA: hypothetical protein [Caudoviricetes sp.]